MNIDRFRAMLDIDPANITPDPAPQSAFMGDECRCPDCRDEDGQP